MGTIQLTRKELYDQVWSEPVSRLAQRYGFSDVWLARICRKNNIPRPPRGYWAIVQSGGKARKTPLPKGDNSKVIEIETYDHNTKREVALSKERIPTKRLSKKIVIPADQTDPHPLVRSASITLASAQEDENGLIPYQKDCLSIQVSRDSLHRALSILDNLIKVLANIGFEILITDESTQVNIDGISLGITIYEELNKRRRIRAVDHDLEGYYRFGYCLYEYKTFPSKRLCFSVFDLGAGSTKGKSWRDSDSRKLEDCLKEFVLSMIRMAARKKKCLLNQETNDTGEPEHK
jgi:hypothetical protein